MAESRKAWSNEPAQWQSSLSSLVAVLAREKRFEEAAQVFNEALRLPASPNLLINGSFEFGTFADAKGSIGRLLFPRAYNITGWTVVGPPGFDLGWMDPQNPGGLRAADGTHFLDLTGAHDSTPYTGVSQTIRTVVGRSYDLSFALGSDANYDRSILPSVAVEITGNPTRLFTVSDVGTNRWQVFNSSFTASNTDTTLTFTGANADNIGYIGLDNVIVTATTNSASGLEEPNAP
jgi:pentatricopeptide repeat protein